MSKRLKHLYEFGEFRFDSEKKVLFRNGNSVPLPPKATEVLALLIEEHGNLVERGEILNTVWRDTFVEDGNLNNAISMLRRTLGGDAVIQTVPRRGYRFTAAVNRIVQEDVEELVIEKRTVTQTTVLSEDEQVRPLTVKNNSVYWLSAAGSVIFALVLGGYLLWGGGTGGTDSTFPRTRSVAFMPLRGVQITDGDGDLAAAGLVESLAARLGSLQDLKVLSTRASRRVAETKSDPLEAGRHLGADSVFEGTYQVAGDRLRLILRLLNVSDGRQIWAGTFDEPLDDVLRLQDIVASQVADGLTERISAEERRRLTKRSTDDPEAYRLYLRGRHEWNKRTAAGLEESIRSFRSAIDRDPSFTHAYAGLADAYALLADYNVERPHDAFPKAKAAALKAIEIDPESARPRTTLAYVLATFDWDYAGAEREYKAAIASEPSYATAHQWYGELLYALHRFEEAAVALDRALELDPLVPITLSERAALLYYKGDLEGALAKFSELKREHPGFATSYIFSAWIHNFRGETELAFENEVEFLKLQGVGDGALAEMKEAFTSGGYRAFLNGVAELHMRDVQGGAFPQYKLPHVFARLKDRDRTLHWIEKCLEARSPNIIKIASDRNFDFVRDDPRFKAAISQLNLADGG